MNVVKCKNGHFFDGDTYTTCPHCGESATNGSAQSPISREPEKKKFSWGKKEKANTDSQERITTEGRTSSGTSSFFSGNTPTDVIEEGAATPSSESETKKKEHTLDFWQTKPDSELSQNNEVHETETSESDVIEQNEVADADDEPHEEKANNTDNNSSLRDAVQKASANSEGKTMSYFSAATSTPAQAGNTTVANSVGPVDPVVGWLVCIAGKHFGESFNIGAGKNSIGRNNDNRIVLSKDNKISRTKHALITYEPKKRNFYLQPGDSSGLTYLNDDYIEESKKLKTRDIIEIGDSKFIFVPLCDETFSWEDFLPKE